MDAPFTPIFSADFLVSADPIWDGFAAQSFVVLDGFLTAKDIKMLREEMTQLAATTPLRQAATGFGESRKTDPAVRGDAIRWIDTADFASAPALQATMERLSQLRLSCNAALYCGLQGFEAHFAHYPAGAGYHRHIDKLKDAPDERFLSFVLYLNENWQESHGGKLRLYTKNLSETVRARHPEYFDVEPVAGRLALFRSDEVWHQVLPTTTDRYTMTGWFLRHMNHLRAVLS